MKKHFLLLFFSFTMNATDDNSNISEKSLPDKMRFKNILFKLRVIEQWHQSDYSYELPSQQEANVLWQEITTCLSQPQRIHAAACFKARRQLKFMELVSQEATPAETHQLSSLIEGIDKNITNPEPEEVIPWNEEDVLTEYGLITGQPEQYASVKSLTIWDRLYLYDVNKCQNSWGESEACKDSLNNLRLSQRRIEEKFKCRKGLTPPTGPLSELERQRESACKFFWKINRTCSNIILQQELSSFVRSFEEDK